MSDEPKAQAMRTARGYRPKVLKNAIDDHLLSMILSLANEVWVMRERLDTIEAIADEKGLVLDREIEAFVAAPERDEKREAMRQEFLDRIFYLLREEVEDAERGETAETYQELLERVAAF
jgi:hypothetical protein